MLEQPHIEEEGKTLDCKVLMQQSVDAHIYSKKLLSLISILTLTASIKHIRDMLTLILLSI